MLYPVLIQERPDGKYEASAPLIPGLTRAGDTRSAAIQEITQAIAEAVSRDDLVFINVPAEQTLNRSPEVETSSKIDPLIGLFNLGDPDLSETVEEILQAATDVRKGWTIKEDQGSYQLSDREIGRRARYHITRNKKTNQWELKQQGSSAPLLTNSVKAALVKEAAARIRNELSQLVIHKADGTIEVERNYGKDVIRS